ncbi:MAG TPA: cell wall hydrolase [Sphingomicrobium sp.]|nr:cell wall hydrolase [Sphingomicrobium sp.]
MIQWLRSRGASAAMALALLGVASSASAQDMSALNNVSAAVRAIDVDSAVKPLGAAAQTVASTVARPAVAATTAISTVNGAVLQAQPAQSVTLSLAPQSFATQAAWLYKNGWPLYALVDKFATNAALDQETSCLATAVYFEARGESLEGQLAVAHVVMNRAASGRYPPDWCSVVKQPAQFSFVRHGEFPSVDTNCDAWRKAEAIAELAASNIVPSVSSDVLWYHADYVAPSWRRNLQEVQQIGAHIFYRA